MDELRKWYFCLSGSTIGRPGHDWEAMVYAAVNSALLNTNLSPIMIYDGEQNNFIYNLMKMGVTVKRHRSSLYSSIYDSSNGDKNYLSIASGAFLRLDIPLLEEDEKYVIYTDCDVLFRRHPRLSLSDIRFLSAAPQSNPIDYENDINSGVLVFNIHNMRTVILNLLSFARKEIMARADDLDQGVLKKYFSGQFDRLPLEMNWKPYWGYNDSVDILHWHGPKPSAVAERIVSRRPLVPAVWEEFYLANPESYAKWLEEWNRYSTLPRGVRYPISASKKATQSSVCQWSRQSTPEADAIGATNGVIDGTHKFHTDLEDSPWWMVDLGKAYRIKEIKIYNRMDDAEYTRRASRLALETSLDGKNFREVYRRETDEPFGGVDGNPLVWQPHWPLVARFVRVRLLTRNYLHLDQVEVYGTEAPPLPEDFDPEGYLALNEDVRAAGVDPVLHWLEFGHREGRRWK